MADENGIVIVDESPGVALGGRSVSSEHSGFSAKLLKNHLKGTNIFKQKIGNFSVNVH